MGHELSGVVIAVGGQVTGYGVGDRVAVAPDVSCGRCWYCRRGLVNLCVDHRMIGTHWPGGFAEYLHLPPQVLVPGNGAPRPRRRVDDRRLPLRARLLRAGCPAERRCRARRHGACHRRRTDRLPPRGGGDGRAGPRGSSWPASRGCRRPERFAPDALIDAGSQDTVAETLRLTDGLGADVAICAAPVAAIQEQAVEAVRKRGKVILFGGLPKTAPMTTLNSNLIHYNELTVVGAFSYPATTHQQALLGDPRRQDHAVEVLQPDRVARRHRRGVPRGRRGTRAQGARAAGQATEEPQGDVNGRNRQEAGGAGQGGQAGARRAARRRARWARRSSPRSAR